MPPWSSQKLNINGRTNAPAASGNPFVSEYNNQMHVAYLANDDTVWDAFYDASSNTWSKQRVDKDGNNPKQLPVMAGPSIGVYLNQQHFCYIRGRYDLEGGEPDPGSIFDSFYDGNGNWPSQQIGSPGAAWTGIELIPDAKNLKGPFLVSIWNFDQQQHFTYLDDSNNIWDAFYDAPSNSWNKQQINNGGNTSAPLAVGKPFGCVFRPPIPPFLPPSRVAGQQHVGYLAVDGEIWDAWFDGQTGHPWTKQKINIDGMTNAPAATGHPFIWGVPTDVFDVFESYHNQQHFTYLASGGQIWDAWYDSPRNRWTKQKLNIDGDVQFNTTNAPAAAGNSFACVVGTVQNGVVGLEEHVGYRDAEGAIWDVWYDGSPKWKKQKVNIDGMTNAPAATGDPFISYFTIVDNDGTVYGQLHFTWMHLASLGLPAQGEIWDAWYELPPLPGQPGGRG